MKNRWSLHTYLLCLAAAVAAALALQLRRPSGRRQGPTSHEGRFARL